ncbi:hypothetical protein V6N13_083466 [Hibiscus sabdariffa]
MFSEFSVCSDGTRNQNKKRRQDEDPPDNENCSPFAPATEAFTVNTNNDSSSAPSFKDMLMEEPVTPQVPAIDNPNNPLFGPWMVVEKRQCRQPKKSTINQSNPTGVTFTESRFNPIFTENPENPTHLPHENTTQFLMPAKQGDSSTQQTRTTQKPKGKSTASSKYSSAVNVRKPLQVTLSEFPMTFRSNRSRRTSNSKAQISAGEGSKLDINKHSTVMVSENFDSNTGYKP